MIYDIDTVIRLNQALRQDIRHSQMRTLVTLLVSSFFIYYWFNTLFEVLLKGYFPLLYRSIVLLPALLNVTAWLVWVAPRYVSLVKGFRASKSVTTNIEATSTNDVIEEYQSTLHQHNRQRRTEIITSVIIGFQIIVMGFIAVFILFNFR